jgi:probable selenium-dependent hydroxylase accessory protein YqeC
MNALRTDIPLRQALLLDQRAVICLVGAGGKTSLMFRLARELAVSGARVLTTTTTKISEQEAIRNASEIVTGSVDALLNRAGDNREEHFHMTAARNGYAGKLIGFDARDIDRLWQANLFDWIIVEADGASRLPLKTPDVHEPVIPDCCDCVVGMAGLTAFGKPLTNQWVFRLQLFASLTGLEAGDTITAAAIVASICRPGGIFKGSPSHARQIAFLNQAETPECLEAGHQVIAGLATRERTARFERSILGQLLFDPPVVEIFDF